MDLSITGATGQISAQPVDKLQNHAGLCFDDGFHHHLADRIHDGNRNTLPTS
jgi:hypothetical protein